MKETKLKKKAQTAIRLTTVAAKKNIVVSKTATKKALRKYIVMSADRETISPKKGAKAGIYKVTITIKGGSKKHIQISRKKHTR